jgi:hypothetical protein
MQSKQDKKKKTIQVRDLKPAKDAKGGVPPGSCAPRAGRPGAQIPAVQRPGLQD